MRQGAQTEGADGVGHRAERADRGHAHDPADDREHHLRDALDAPQHADTGIARRLQTEAEQHRDQQDREDLAAGQGGDEAVRDDPEEEVDEALGRLGRRWRQPRRAEVAGVDVHPRAGLDDLDDSQADQHRESRQHLEVEQCFAGDPADRPHALDRRDAGDDGAEDQRRDHHPDERDEGVAEWLELGAESWPQGADDSAQHDRAENLDVELAAGAAQPAR